MMKKLLITTLFVSGFLIFLPLATEAADYAGFCTVQNTTCADPYSCVKANTLDEARNINNLYYEYWGRDAGCDEVQFHVDHVTSHDRLANWLGSTTDTREYGFIGTAGIDHLEGQTVSFGFNVRGNGAPRHVYFVNNGYRYRIYDVATAASWGLDPFTHRYNIHHQRLMNYFYDRYPDGGPLNYMAGNYADEVSHYIWDEDHPIDDDLPQLMQDYLEAATMLYEGLGAFSGPGPAHAAKVLFDWRYIGQDYTGSW